MTENQPSVNETARLWFAAFLAGILGALAMTLFHAASDAIEWLLTRQKGSLVEVARSLPLWARVLVPTLGGIMAGVVLHLGRDSGEHIDYIDAAREGKIKLNDQTNAFRTLSSLFSVGSGASIGREGPMVQLSAWFSSWLARVFPIPEGQRNAILVCGIASGIASAYHAPAAGVVFVLELALGFFARHTVAPVLISAVTSIALIFWMVEPSPLYAMPSLPPVPVTPKGLLIALAAGAGSGLLGLLLLKLIEISKAAFGNIKPLWIRLGIGGAIVGLISAPVPEVWGNGYDVVSKVLDGGLSWKWVAAALVAKIIATIASTSSGAIGGIFTPTLFVGATSGYLIGFVSGTDPVVMSIVCMSAVLAAVTQAPLMAIVMVLEMTDQFHLVLPVMLACGTAYAVSTQFGAKPLYGNPIEHHA
ncbi:MAG: chloride channel protein [Burkholderiales bacterium 21-58-4]|nr:MAG: chloride channel protein [Burkholderiales bacterium 21-58-4]